MAGRSRITEEAARMEEKLDIKPEIESEILKWVETEIWGAFSEQLKRFFVRLSLIEHRSQELFDTLIGESTDLRYEFEHYSSYITYNKYISAYVIQPLFLEYLKMKQGQLSEDEKRETYRAAACWCEQNDFLVDALVYYEKIGDQKSGSLVTERLERRILNTSKELSGHLDRQMT